MKNKRPSFAAYKKRALENEELKAAYDLLEPEFALLEKFIKARKKARYSQSELAERLHLQQPAIARLEKGGYITTSVGKLAQVADALGYSIKISLSPKKTSTNKSKSKKV
jgi:DNA-binding XRE family transcriptional regulator